MYTDVITAIVLAILAVLFGLRRIVRALGLLMQESSRFLGDIVVFSKKGRMLRSELRRWRKRRRGIREKKAADAIEAGRSRK